MVLALNRKVWVVYFATNLKDDLKLKLQLSVRYHFRSKVITVSVILTV